ncbi:MAG: septum formation protein Maf [Ignavibacteria bacterium]|nr:septum formation protein Maf [Ignavibacteria bacterium]
MPILKSILNKRYILASASPRRAGLLRQLGFKFVSIESKAVEMEIPDNDPVHSVKHNSVIKSRTVAALFKKEIVIGADTVVVHGNKIINKPKNLKDAENILERLSGKVHNVYTGVNVINTSNGKEIFSYEKTSVYFRKLDRDEISYYVKKHRPLDKAGAYGIQDDFGCLFIKKIEGDYYNIVGLPLVKLYECIKKII